MATKYSVTKEIFSKRLKELMSDNNETTYSVGEILNLSAATISRYTDGKMAPKITTIYSMATYFNVNPVWLMGYDVEKKLKKQTNNHELSQEETTLLENYNKLNAKGKEKLLDYSDDLTTNIKYMNNTDNEISATKDNVIEFNNKKDDEEVFVPYKSFDELGAKCNAAHADDLTPEKLEHAKQVILEAENEFKLAEWNKKHNK